MDDGQTDDRPLRRAYIVMLAIPLGLVAAVWVLAGAQEPFTRVLYPSVAIVYGGLLLGFLTRRLSVSDLKPWVFIAPTAILAGRLASWELQPPSRPELGMIIVVLAWFGVAFALAFLAFGTRRGAVISLLGYLALYGAMGWSASQGMLARHDVREVVAVAGAHAVLLAVVWVLARNVEQLAAARAKVELLALLATTDALTGIANRRRLDDELQRLVAQAQRYRQPLSVLLVDLDHFKGINDRFGHAVGDRVLVSTVAQLSGAVRDADLLGRWGGEEFLLLAPHTDHAGACALAERCRDAITRAGAERGDLAVTASFGVATLGPDEDARALMRHADHALYAAKTEGRNRVVGTRVQSDEMVSDDAQVVGERGDGRLALLGRQAQQG